MSVSDLRRSRKKPVVTIISAMVCKEGILVAADSRTTNDDLTIRDDAIKIHIVEATGGSAIIAHSGSADIGPRLAEIVEHDATDLVLNDNYRAFAELCQCAAAKLKAEIGKQYPGTTVELQQHFEDYRAELLIAHYFRKTPHIFTMNFALGVATLRKENPVSIGCGAPLAGFLFDSFEVSEMPLIKATAVAVYVLDRVKTYDPRCGGVTRAAFTHWIRRGKNKELLKTHEWGSETISGMQAAVTRIEAKAKNAWREKMDRVILNYIVNDLKSRGVAVDPADAN